jgi:hypothetical protein
VTAFGPVICIKKRAERLGDPCNRHTNYGETCPKLISEECRRVMIDEDGEFGSMGDIIDWGTGLEAFFLPKGEDHLKVVTCLHLLLVLQFCTSSIDVMISEIRHITPAVFLEHHHKLRLLST